MPKPNKNTKERKDIIIKLVGEGKTKREIAEILNLKLTILEEYCRNHNISFRKKCGRKSGNISTIAKQNGLGYASVSQYMRRKGVTLEEAIKALKTKKEEETLRLKNVLRSIRKTIKTEQQLLENLAKERNMSIEELKEKLRQLNIKI